MSSSRRRISRIAFGLLCAVLGVVLASGVALQGKRYFYCAQMGVVIDDPCAASTPIDRDVSVHELETDCCRVGRMPSVPLGALAAGVDLPAAPLVAVGPIATVVVPPPAPAAHANERATGPPRSPPDRVHARVMVFLT